MFCSTDVDGKDEKAMIHLYSWDTSNGRKIAILLEELGLPFVFHPIDITAGEQFDPEFLAISPNNKIPAIVDSDGPGGEPISVFESGAIHIRFVLFQYHFQCFLSQILQGIGIRLQIFAVPENTAITVKKIQAFLV